MSVKDCFSKAASKYDQHCQLQFTTGQKLLSLVEPAENVIDLGCGTGIITAKLKYKKLYALDLSDKMLSVAKKRLGEHNITYLEASFDDVNNLKLDLAFANMSLQWSDNLKLTLANIKENLALGGILAFSIPLVGTFAGINISSISFFSLKEVEEMLGDWGIIHTSQEEINYSFSSLIEALRSIKSVGANYCNLRKKVTVSREKSPQILKYQIGYFVVRKPYA